MASPTKHYDEDLTTKKPTGEHRYIEHSGTKLTDGDGNSEILDASARPAAERHLVRKLDRRLLPTIILIFIMNYIDVRQLRFYGGVDSRGADEKSIS